MGRLKFWPVLPFLVVFSLLVLGLSLKSRFDEPCPCGKADPGASADFNSEEKQAFFEGKEVLSPLAAIEEKQKVLGETAGDKWIEVDLSEQKLRAWEDSKLILESLVSSGKWAPTPTGEFTIWSKLKYTKMEGGKKGTGTYYYLPNVPYTMYFYKGYGLHGTYWHNNFGQPMSHGCINLPSGVAQQLFFWANPPVPAGKNMISSSKANPGTKVVIHI